MQHDNKSVGSDQFPQKSCDADVATQQLSPAPRTEAHVCCLSVKTLHDQWNEIKNSHPFSQERSLEKLLAFPVNDSQKDALQKVYDLVHPYK